VANLILVIAQLYSLIILARVLMSWVQVDPYSPLAQTIYQLTEPVLAPVRNALGSAGGLDFSPIIVIIGIQFIATMLAQAFAGL
jgi:YggT family protein